MVRRLEPFMDVGITDEAYALYKKLDDDEFILVYDKWFTKKKSKGRYKEIMVLTPEGRKHKKRHIGMEDLERVEL